MSTDFSCKYVEQSLISEIYSNGWISTDWVQDFGVNEYLLLRSISNNQSTALAKVTKDSKLILVDVKSLISGYGVTPKDARQAIFLDSLVDPNILLNVATGPAGTGKSFLTCSYALQKMFEEDKTIYLSKPTAMIGKGRAFGPVPGDVNDKYKPFIASFDIVMKKISQDKKNVYLDMLIKQEKVKFMPIEFVRGCTFDDAVFILDEAQNLSWHELNSIVSRMGENTNMILLGDLNQVDVNIPRDKTGLYKLVNSKAFKQSEITSSVALTKQYRSPITGLIAEVDKELREKGFGNK